MHESLIPLLKIQELDLKMMQLMKLKRARIEELDNLRNIKSDLDRQVAIKGDEIQELKRSISRFEGEVTDIVAKLKKLEGQQTLIKKVDEFNALSREMADSERERAKKESDLSDLYDKLAGEEEILTNLKTTLENTRESSQQLESEIRQRIVKINEEGRSIQQDRELLANGADAQLLQIYERLLSNKRDRVIVPIENRCCSGCHITVTAQDENLVRKGERLIFCEHCSRIHYWLENTVFEESGVAPKKRRKRIARV